MQLSPETVFLTALETAQTKAPIEKLGVAVSGGGDSIALLLIAHDWARAHDVQIFAATVNHGLRDGAIDEALMVAATCRGLNIPHQTLLWTDWDKTGNLQDAARRARYRLLADWGREMDVQAIMLGHTQDDQAETTLMRMARGSGVDGLSAMATDWHAEHLRWLRPLLKASRENLRGYLTAKGQAWVEDPSNDDVRFGRVKARKILRDLEPLGLDSRRFAENAEKQSMASKALRHYAHQAATEFCRVESGDVVIETAILGAPSETLHRVIAHALKWVASKEYRPRYDALLHMLDQIQAGNSRSLHGCLIVPNGRAFRICREYQAVQGDNCAPDTLWDNRWQVVGASQDVQVRALGDAVSDCPNWRETGLPRTSLKASPSVWRQNQLLAAPLAGMAEGWSATLAPKTGDFFTSILCH